MKQIMRFLGALQDNNSREWFTTHKADYLECKATFDRFTEQLIAGIREFDDTVGELTPKDCTYRIYRDTRFSADKTPYKTHMGCYIVPGGKKSGYSGYYLQVGPDNGGYPAGCMLATGNYCFEPPVIKTLREDILADDDHLFTDALREAQGFRLDRDNDLRRVPAGFPADHPLSDYLRLRTFCLVKDTGRDYMLRPDMLATALRDFRSTLPFLRFINRAVTYVKEELA